MFTSIIRVMISIIVSVRLNGVINANKLIIEPNFMEIIELFKVIDDLYAFGMLRRRNIDFFVLPN